MNSYELTLAIALAMQPSSELANRYRGKIQEGTTIKGILDALQTQNLLMALIRTDWRNDGRDRDGLYLIREGQRFQVFRGERGIKHLVKEFQDLRTACFVWVDSALNQLHYLAPDSKIG